VKKVKIARWALAAAAAGMGVSAGSADVLLDQPIDWEDRYHSSHDPAGIQFGDDFRPSEDVVVESVEFTMVASWPNAPTTWSFSVHRAYTEHEWYPLAPFIDHFFRMFGPSSVIDLGAWPEDENLHVFVVRFDNIGLRLQAGVADLGAYWFSCAGHLANYPTDKCYWATANHGVRHGDEGYYKYEPPDFPGWSRMSRANARPSDFAMRIEGVPAAEWRPTTELTAFAVDYGSHASGDLDDIREAGDDEVITVLSRPSRRDGEKYHTMTFDASARVLLEAPDVIDVSVSADVQGLFRVPEATLQLHNWRTGKWDEVGRYDIYVERVTWPFRGINAADYVREDGLLVVRFEVLSGPMRNGQRFTFSFEANIDRVRIDARNVN
jgi:hypothetical protein